MISRQVLQQYSPFHQIGSNRLKRDLLTIPLRTGEYRQEYPINHALHPSHLYGQNEHVSGVLQVA